MNLGRWDTVKSIMIRPLQTPWQFPRAHGSHSGHSPRAAAPPEPRRLCRGAATRNTHVHSPAPTLVGVDSGRKSHPWASLALGT